VCGNELCSFRRVSSTSDPSLADVLQQMRPFTRENRWKSGWSVASTLVLLGGISVIAACPRLPWPARAAASVLESLLIVRTFVLFHDLMHGALLRGSTLAKVCLYPFAAAVLTPPGVWRFTHNYHHAHTAKLVGSHVGSFATTTRGIFATMTPWQQRMYLAQRHPLMILSSLFTVFALGMCWLPFWRDPRRNWDGLVTLLWAAFLATGLFLLGGWSTLFFAYLLPVFLACAMGSYLFYAQHNCPGLKLAPRQEWTYLRAALESSSQIRMSRLMHYFTANIGYHHLHHLNPAVPYYRLPEVAEKMPQLQACAVTTLSPRDIWRCLSLKVWDPAAGSLVPLPAKLTRSTVPESPPDPRPSHPGSAPS